MKKIIPTIILIFVINTIALSQKLSADAQDVKEKAPHVYNPIKEGAVREWGNNHIMVVATINAQIKDLVFVMEELKKMTAGLIDNGNKEENRKWMEKNPDFLLLRNAINSWSSTKDWTEAMTDSNSNWVMISTQYKEQLKASKQY